MKEVELNAWDLAKQILDLPYTNVINNNGILIPESDYGFAEIYRFYDDIMVFTIPQYGGTPQFYKCVGRHCVESLVEELRKLC